MRAPTLHAFYVTVILAQPLGQQAVEHALLNRQQHRVPVERRLHVAKLKMAVGDLGSLVQGFRGVGTKAATIMGSSFTRLSSICRAGPSHRPVSARFCRQIRLTSVPLLPVRWVMRTPYSAMAYIR